MPIQYVAFNEKKYGPLSVLIITRGQHDKLKILQADDLILRVSQ